MVGRWVAADDNQTAGAFVVGVGIAGCAAAQRGQHGFDRWAVAQAGAVVNVVAAHYEAGELLLNVTVFVGGLGGTEGGEGIAAILDESGGDQIQSLVPGGLAEGTGVAFAVADQGRLDAVGMLGEGISETALDAEHPDAGEVVRVVVGGDDAVGGVVDFQLDTASDAAIRTSGTDGVGGVCNGRRFLDADGAGGANAEALAAGGADALGEGFVGGGGDAGRFAGSQHVDGADELVAGLAGVDAAGTEDAGVHREVEDRVRRIGGLTGPRVPAAGRNAVEFGCGGQLTIPADLHFPDGERLSGRVNAPVAQAKLFLSFGQHQGEGNTPLPR